MNKMRRFLAVLLTFCMIFTTQTATLWASVIPKGETAPVDGTTAEVALDPVVNEEQPKGPLAEIPLPRNPDNEAEAGIVEEDWVEEKAVGSQPLLPLTESLTFSVKEGESTENVPRDGSLALSVTYKIADNMLNWAKFDPTWTLDLSTMVSDSLVSSFSGDGGFIMQGDSRRGTYEIKDNIVYLKVDPMWLFQQRFNVSGTFELSMNFDKNEISDLSEYEYKFPGGSTVKVKFEDISLGNYKKVGPNIYNMLAENSGKEVNVAATLDADGKYSLYYETGVSPSMALTVLSLSDTLEGGQVLDADSITLNNAFVSSDYVTLSTSGTGFTVDIAGYLGSTGAAVEAGKYYFVKYRTKIDANKLGALQSNTANWSWKGGTSTSQTSVTPVAKKDYSKLVDKSLTVSGEGVGAVLTHTITVNQDKINIAGFTIKDVMNDAQKLVGTINVTPAIDGQTTISVTGTEITDEVYSTNEKEVFVFTFPSEGTYTETYTITYQTEIPDTAGAVEGKQWIGDSVTVTDPNGESAKKNPKKEILFPEGSGGVVNPKITKSLKSWDLENDVVYWTVTVEIEDGYTYDSVKLTEKNQKFGYKKDALNLSAEILWSQVKAVDTDNQPVEFEHKDGENSLTFNSLSKTVIVTIPTKVNVRIEDQDVLWATNTVDMDVNGEWVAYASDTGSHSSDKLKMTKNVSYDKETEEWSWTIIVNPEYAKFESDYEPFFKDALPDGMELIDNNFSIYLRSNNNTNSSGNMVWGDKTSTVTVDASNGTIPNTSLVAPFSANGENAPSGISGMQYEITYKTKLTDAEKKRIVGMIEPQTYANSAEIQDGNPGKVKSTATESTTYSYKFISV